MFEGDYFFHGSAGHDSERLRPAHQAAERGRHEFTEQHELDPVVVLAYHEAIHFHSKLPRNAPVLLCHGDQQEQVYLDQRDLVRVLLHSCRVRLKHHRVHHERDGILLRL